MDLDYQLKKYWTFFSNRCFNEGERVHFFCDGSFAIYNSTKIQYYDSDCNATDIILGNDLRILASGITISVGNDRISVLRSGINKCSEIIISKKAGSSVLNSASLVLITNQNTNLAEIYKIEASYKPLVAKISQINVELPYDKIYKIESSLDILCRHLGTRLLVCPVNAAHFR